MKLMYYTIISYTYDLRDKIYIYACVVTLRARTRYSLSNMKIYLFDNKWK